MPRPRPPPSPPSGGTPAPGGAARHGEPSPRPTCDEGNACLVAWWALRNQTTAVAVLRQDRLLFVNECWTALERELRGPLRLQGDGQRTFEGLREAAAALASLSTRSSVRVQRYTHLPSGRVLQLHAERRPEAGPGRVFVMGQEVTGSVRQERELEAARGALEQRARLQALGELASGVAHDFNNVFFALKLRLESLARRLEGPHQERMHQLIRLLSEENARVARLQDFAAHRADGATESSDLAEVVSQAIELVRPSLRQRRQALGADLDLRCLLDPQLPRVVGGAADLRHVFVNLLLNARDAMPRGGAVEIAARRERGAVVVEVADSGVGIAPDHLPHLFDPFFTTRPGQGTGLGLAMCAGVMRRLGGQIEAANRPGGGAVFRLRFPLAPLARAEAPAGRLRPPGARRRGTGGGAAHPR